MRRVIYHVSTFPLLLSARGLGNNSTLRYNILSLASLAYQKYILFPHK